MHFYAKTYSTQCRLSILLDSKQISGSCTCISNGQNTGSQSISPIFSEWMVAINSPCPLPVCRRRKLLHSLNAMEGTASTLIIQVQIHIIEIYIYLCVWTASGVSILQYWGFGMLDHQWCLVLSARTPLMVVRFLNTIETPLVVSWDATCGVLKRQNFTVYKAQRAMYIKLAFWIFYNTLVLSIRNWTSSTFVIRPTVRDMSIEASYVWERVCHSSFPHEAESRKPISENLDWCHSIARWKIVGR
jgi:hypothetical protein